MSIWAVHKRKWYYKEWLHRNKQSDVCNFICSCMNNTELDTLHSDAEQKMDKDTFFWNCLAVPNILCLRVWTE